MKHIISLIHPADTQVILSALISQLSFNHHVRSSCESWLNVQLPCARKQMQQKQNKQNVQDPNQPTANAQNGWCSDRELRHRGHHGRLFSYLFSLLLSSLYCLFLSSLLSSLVFFCPFFLSSLFIQKPVSHFFCRQLLGPRQSALQSAELDRSLLAKKHKLSRRNSSFRSSRLTRVQLQLSVQVQLQCQSSDSILSEVK